MIEDKEHLLCAYLPFVYILWILFLLNFKNYLFFSRSFEVFALLFECVISLELLFVHGELRAVVHTFCDWLSPG